MRWVQFGAVSGVMRTESNGFAIPAKTRPQVFDDDQLPNWKRYAKLRTQLEPYVAAALADYRRSGMPLMRHLALVDPLDPVAVSRDDEFLFGPDVLAAPVLSPGTTTRDVYLPAGSWVDLWRSGAWDSAAGAFVLGQARILDGGGNVTVPAPIDELPLFVRAGAVLPLLPADVDTLADYGAPREGFVRLGDRNDEMRLLAFPRGRSTAALSARGEQIRSEEDGGAWSLDVDAKRARTSHLEASLARLTTPFVPCTVDWDGGHLPDAAWFYDLGTHVLRAAFRGRAGRLSVRPCG